MAKTNVRKRNIPTPGRRGQNGSTIGKRRGFAAVGVILSLLAASAAVARWGGSSTMRPGAGPAPAGSPFALDAAHPSKEYIYAGGRLIATEEESGCSGGITASDDLTATASSTATVTLEWTAFTGGPVHHYEVERRSAGSFVTVIFNVPPNTVSVQDTNTLNPNTAYLYRVRAFDSANCPSPYSNTDLATTTIFDEDPLQGQLTTIRTVHITQLRQAVDAVRLTANIGEATWTNPLQDVSAVHFSELRTNLNQALDELSVLGLSPMPIDPAIAPTNTVFAAHLQAVREKVK